MLIVTTQNDEKSKSLNSIWAVGELGLETHLNIQKFSFQKTWRMIEGQQRVCFDTFLLVFLLGRFPCNRYDSVLLFKEKSHQLQYWRKQYLCTRLRLLVPPQLAKVFEHCSHRLEKLSRRPYFSYQTTAENPKWIYSSIFFQWSVKSIYSGDIWRRFFTPLFSKFFMPLSWLDKTKQGSSQSCLLNSLTISWLYPLNGFRIIFYSVTV